MRRTLFIAVAILLPLGALALDYTNSSAQYTDAPFSKPEAVAISVLTNLGVVKGNPDGTFAAKRSLNRAEFLKIAMLSAPVSTGQGEGGCFPDVPASEWFAAYVCGAKESGIVEGNPDGKFHPERPVNYAEALKMLANLFRYTRTALSSDAWYDPYVRAAREHGTLLPLSITLDTPLTRGQMTRLTAAFVAEARGELAQYRVAEQGKALSSSSSVSSGTGSSTSSSSSSSTSSFPSSSSLSSLSSLSSSSSSPPFLSLPAKSRFLMVGNWSEPIASATFNSTLEPALIRNVTVKLKTKISSISSMEVLDRDRVRVGLLALDYTDDDDLTWTGTFLGSGAYVLPKNTERTLAVRVLLKAKDAGGVSEQLVQVDTFTIVAEGEWSHNSFGSAPQTYTFPKHQTTMAIITEVKNMLPEQGVLQVGSHQLLGEFSFAGSGVATVSPRIQNIAFTVNKSTTIAVSDWQVQAAEGGEILPCSVSEMIVSCLTLPESMGTLGATPRSLRLFGDIAVDQGAQYPFLQADLQEAGTVGTGGAIHWTDGLGRFTWTELNTPIARGTKWQG
ncbi:MAG: S-layer homology domain-containing protein [Patescibacteria group bacterium]